MREKYIAPELGLEAFNCPICGAYSHQQWQEVFYQPNFYQVVALESSRLEMIKQRAIVNNIVPIISFSRCFRCKGFTIWEGPSMIHPNASIVEPPNLDMPVDIQALYNEARSIASLSPKSAAALLRLALEKLLIDVGAKKGSIDFMIQDLIDKEVISSTGSVRKALDSIRVIGNAGVHPTGINLDEDPTAALALFKVINFVVDKLITEEKEMKEIYALVPEDKREKLDIRRSK